MNGADGQRGPADIVLHGGTVLDGTGRPGRLADVVIRGGRIGEIRERAAGAPNLAAGAVRSHELIIDVAGRIVCPGFVDIHTHSDLTLLSCPAAPSTISQGVTTIVVGNCGLGTVPQCGGGSGSDIRAALGHLDLDPAVVVDWRDLNGYFDRLQAASPGVNVAVLAAHLPIRAGILGMRDTAASDRQLAAMADLAAEAFVQGAVGLSTGLAYPPMTFAGETELVRLGEVVAEHDRLFAWHVRDYGDDLLVSVRQALDVARRTGCRTQISHLIAVGRRNWGTVRDALTLVDEARAAGQDVGVDAYPYLAGSAPLEQLLPDWAKDGSHATVAARLYDPVYRRRITRSWATPLGWDEIIISALPGGADQAAIGRSIADLASECDGSGDDVALDLIAKHGSYVGMIAYGRSEADLRAVLTHPAAVVASDGQSLDPSGVTGRGHPHPRSYGCFPRYLRHWASSLADGVRRCTSAPADRVGLDRGRVQIGAVADLVVLDPERLTDCADFVAPQQFAAGIDLVFVRGIAATGGLPGAGRVLRALTSAQPQLDSIHTC